MKDKRKYTVRHDNDNIDFLKRYKIIKNVKMINQGNFQINFLVN